MGGLGDRVVGREAGEQECGWDEGCSYGHDRTPMDAFFQGAFLRVLWVLACGFFIDVKRLGQVPRVLPKRVMWSRGQNLQPRSRQVLTIQRVCWVDGSVTPSGMRRMSAGKMGVAGLMVARRASISGRSAGLVTTNLSCRVGAAARRVLMACGLSRFFSCRFAHEPSGSRGSSTGVELLSLGLMEMRSQVSSGATVPAVSIVMWWPWA